MNKINYKFLYLLQIAVAVFAIIPLFLGDLEAEEVSIPKNTYWMTILGYVIFIFGVALDFMSGRKTRARIVILVLASLTGLACLRDGVGLFIAALILFCFPYIIVLIVAVVHKSSPAVKVDAPKTLPIGILSKKDTTILVSSILLMIIIGVGATALTMKLYDNNNGILVLILLVPIIVLIIRKTNTNVNLLRIINKEMNYEKFNDEINKILKNNLHPETYNYLMIIKANYLFAYNLEEAIELSYSLKEPSAKQYKQIYYSVMATVYIHTNRLDEFSEVIKNNTLALQSALLNYKKAVATTDEMLNIEAAFSVYKKIPFSNASSYYTRMVYYSRRGNTLKAIENAKIIKNFCPGLKQYVKEADLILNDINN